MAWTPPLCHPAVTDPSPKDYLGLIMVGSHFHAGSICFLSLAYVQILTEIAKKKKMKERKKPTRGTFTALSNTSGHEMAPRKYPPPGEGGQKTPLVPATLCAHSRLPPTWEFCHWLGSVPLTCSCAPHRSRFRLESVMLHLPGFRRVTVSPHSARSPISQGVTFCY